MRKLMLFIVILFCAVVVVIFWRKKEKKLSFDDITNGLSKDVKRIEPDNDMDGIEWIGSLKKKKFDEYNGDLGNTSRQDYITYNSDNKKLFTIIELVIP